MKRLICLLLALLLVMALPVAAEEGGDIVLIPANAQHKVGVSVTAEYSTGLRQGAYLGFTGVDLTGINTITMESDVIMPLGVNGETVRVLIDDPVKGDQIASIVVDGDKEKYFDAYVEPTQGVHDIYFLGNYYNALPNNFKIKSFTLKKEAYNDTALSEQVPDTAVRNWYMDTWTAVDDMGRKIADYSEVGAPKKDRTVGILAWNWFKDEGAANARIIPELIAQYPDALENVNSEAWKDGNAEHYWGEPIFGFYGSTEYWVIRQQLELMAAAGIDTLMFDWSNMGQIFTRSTVTYVDAMRDLKKEGMDVPKMTAFPSNVNNADEDNLLLAALYNVGWVENDWSDVWFYWDGKPLLFGFPNAKHIKSHYDPNDKSAMEFCETIDEFFTWRKIERNNPNAWNWLESFPQMIRTAVARNDGRPEFINVGMALNSSYAYPGKQYVFSEPYTMAKSYSYGFGEDLSADGMRKGWQFRDQARQALEVDPHFVLIDGWNEFTADRQAETFGFKNAFVDTFNDNNSRDFEPAKGALGDDYYNLLVDFVRKYKGAQAAPLAGADKTIAVTGDLAQWDDVTPAFYNAKGLNRDSDSGYLNYETGTVWHYTTRSADRVTFSKVSKDANNLYFLAKTAEGQSINNSAVYINIDRNKATGFEGYDFVIGRGNTGAVEKINADGTYTYLGEATVSRNANAVQMAVSRAVLGEAGVADFEFKWITGTFTDILSIYENSNAAPIGRFNYLYTEIPQRALTDAEKTLAKGSAIYKAGSVKMIVDGGIVNVYEPDTAVAPFEMYNTLYIPAEAVEEYLGYGRGRVDYDKTYNLFYMYTYEMNEELTDISKRNWYYTNVGTLEGRANGAYKTLTAPVVADGGKIYVPISIFADLMGKEVKALGNGAYAVGTIDAASATNLLSYIG